MKVISLEEHVSFPDIIKQMPPEVLAAFGKRMSFDKHIAKALADTDDDRLKSMDKTGISLQILSVVGPGSELLDNLQGPVIAKQYNDALAQRLTSHPDRFTAFAHLPMGNPQAASDELERAVQQHQFKGALINGLTQEKFLDDPMFAPVLKKAEELGVPLYLHPGLPPEAVFNSYYTHLPKHSGQLLSIAGWGWHSETALHILRLVVSGTFDRYPKLKIIIGHMGEMLPMMLVRCDSQFKPGQAGENKRGLRETLLDQVHITTSGIFTAPPLIAAIETFGIDNILFSVDYPFSSNEQGVDFLNNLTLSAADTEKIAHINAENLLNLN